MFTDINQKLQQAIEDLRKKKKFEDHLQRANDLLNEEITKRDELKAQLLKEKEDVNRLETFTLTNIFYTITGRKLEKLDKEQQEVLVAKLKYKEALETIEDLEKEIQGYNEELTKVTDAELKYKEILEMKKQLIHHSNTIWSEELYRLDEQEAEITSNLLEYEEAISAGKKALASLGEAIQSLDSAQGWSTFDMLGGGLISTAVKHSYLDEAKENIHEVQKELRHFQDELQDIENHYKMDLEIGGLLTFADYFFDGIIFDWFVHGQITDCYDQVVKTEEDVSELVKKITKQMNELEREQSTIKARRKEILESAE